MVLRHTVLNDALSHLIVGQLFLCAGGECQAKGKGGEGDQSESVHRDYPYLAP